MKAYHGTLNKNVSDIKINGFSSTKRGGNRLPNDLGIGVYSFVEGDYTDPRQLAQAYICHFVKHSKNPNEPYAVLGFDVSLKALILNLDNESQAINQFRSDNLDQIKNILETKFSGKQNAGLKHRGNFDGVVIQLFLDYLLNDKGIQFDAARKDTFTNISDSGYKQSNFFNGTELCIYNQDIISNIQEA